MINGELTERDHSVELTLIEITSFDDPLYDRWLDLYQISFPLNEQMLVSSLNALLRDRNRLGNGRKPILACVNERGDFKALVHYESFPDRMAAVLWYFAVEPEARSQGIGSAAYSLLLRRLQIEQPDIRSLFFEVEDPNACESLEQKHHAQRRIAFYRRNGAAQLTGIHYLQSVGWQPPLQMCLLVHRYAAMQAEEALALAQHLFNGEKLAQDGVLALE